MEYPTDTRLLFDAIRKVIEWLMQVCKTGDLLDWQEGQEQIRELKKLRRQLQRLKPSSAKDEAKKEARQQAIVEAHQEYLRVARAFLQRAEKTWQELRQKHPESKNKPTFRTSTQLLEYHRSIFMPTLLENTYI